MKKESSRVNDEWYDPSIEECYVIRHKWKDSYVYWTPIGWKALFIAETYDDIYIRDEGVARSVASKLSPYSESKHDKRDVEIEVVYSHTIPRLQDLK